MSFAFLLVILASIEEVFTNLLVQLNLTCFTRAMLNYIHYASVEGLNGEKLPW